MASTYIGRFAPSPTGPLHFGSLVSALASYLEARQRQGKWFIRIEDVDGTRCKPAFAEQILTTLQSYHLISDDKVEVQSQHHPSYQYYLEQLEQQGQLFPCNCTRQSLQPFQGRHPHICDSHTDAPHSWRLKSCELVYQYQDPIQGTLIFTDDLKNTSPILKRKDGYFSYQLAVVVDDHRQNITHLVRGADLIETTAQQLHLYSLFNWTPPELCHIPLIVNQNGDKISKQNHAKAITDGDITTLLCALKYLGLKIQALNMQDALDQAIRLWDIKRLKGQSALPIQPQDWHLIQ
ncbi:tRNA glutamyl-Q(34) synthetase GluQRS [Marinomonas posidonica]|uniref:Glutamyl-queuosine tRNA(Asp) synthetase n=1 Tax=Marinomonas posidonica (strain CECT 7376 / NCIMB 14433 / IVIA-Po-181) TaxID=491952 RepID=F6CXR1_MARPP|nr:tRNA glutamyl-Q(34) synthetase GluQRS [Marinomonas posidonica]AEF53374.1 glutamyl-queuosine tRNA(Asp) synthetase [Marinomonas posidonica IVIA-Po-181]